MTAERKGLGLILIAALFLAGCNLQTGSPGPRTWIDAPLDGTTVEVAPLVVRSHASSDGGTQRARLLVNGEEVRADGAVDTANPLIEFAQAWTPPGPGAYRLQVVSTDNHGNDGHSNVVLVIVGGEVVAAATTPVPAAEAEATATFTQQAPTSPIFVFNVPANCREGPSQAYSVALSFLEGQQAPIEGRNADNSWFWVVGPNGGHCWVSTVTGTPQGPYTTVAVVNPPPPPAVTTEAPPTQEPTPPPPQPPAAPGGFNVANQQCDSDAYIVRLSWNDVSGEQGYRVYRDAVLIFSLGANATSYDDNSGDYNGHAYRVEAWNGVGTGTTGTKNSTGCLY
jgi:hypothetical protein